MDFEQVRNYWEERASADNSAQSTTQDYYLRDIEFRVVRDQVAKLGPAAVMDVGCGDARTTARLAAEFQKVRFIGGDYSESMVKNARSNLERAGIDNLTVQICDVSTPLPFSGLDLIYSTRCLINLPQWELQKTALSNISNALSSGGHYVMIENFTQGQENFNRVRREYGLPEISVRDHNLFFDRERLLEFTSDTFELVEEQNISSTYYLVSRVIYSKLCQKQGVSPDYFDPHHEYAAKLPFSGEFGPVRMICMRRK